VLLRGVTRQTMAAGGGGGIKQFSATMPRFTKTCIPQSAALASYTPMPHAVLGYTKIRFKKSSSDCYVSVLPKLLNTSRYSTLYFANFFAENRTEQDGMNNTCL